MPRVGLGENSRGGGSGKTHEVRQKGQQRKEGEVHVAMGKVRGLATGVQGGLYLCNVGLQGPRYMWGTVGTLLRYLLNVLNVLLSVSL